MYALQFFFQPFIHSRYSNTIKFVTSVFIIFIDTSYGENIECSHTKIWGPGLEPENIIMPARYFFVQTFDINNKR